MYFASILIKFPAWEFWGHSKEARAVDIFIKRLFEVAATPQVDPKLAFGTVITSKVP